MSALYNIEHEQLWWMTDEAECLLLLVPMLLSIVDIIFYAYSMFHVPMFKCSNVAAVVHYTI